MKKCGIFILTQNTIERKLYLKTCLYFLYKNFNHFYNYPVIILHDGDYDNESQEEIKACIRLNHRDTLSFYCIDKNDFNLPVSVDEKKLKEIIELNPVPYWRNIKYRLMCRWWLFHFFKYTQDYDYIMRIDDDSIIEEVINTNLFKLMEEKKLVYISNILHADCGICCYDMKNVFKKILKNTIDYKKLDALFTEVTIDDKNNYFNNFCKLYKLVNNKEYDKKTLLVSMPIMYYNNFMITDVSFWNRPDVKKILKEVDETDYIFYYRYGDAPIQTLITNLLEPTKVERHIFKYSKRLQREAHRDDKNVLHSFFPNDYKHTSCLSYKPSEEK